MSLTSHLQKHTAGQRMALGVWCEKTPSWVHQGLEIHCSVSDSGVKEPIARVWAFLYIFVYRILYYQVVVFHRKDQTPRSTATVRRSLQLLCTVRETGFTLPLLSQSRRLCERSLNCQDPLTVQRESCLLHVHIFSTTLGNKSLTHSVSSSLLDPAYRWTVTPMLSHRPS